MKSKITYDDKMAFVTDYVSKLPNAEQIELLDEAPSELTIFKTVDFLYDRVSTIVARHNSGLRLNKPKSLVPNALCPAKPLEESD